MNRKALRESLSPPMLRRSIGVSLVIGTVLTAINQGDAILAGQSPAIWKIALTYLVPFLVATHGAYGAMALNARSTRSKAHPREDGQSRE